MVTSDNLHPQVKDFHDRGFLFKRGGTLYKPKTLDEAMVIIGKLRRDSQKFFFKMSVAKARVYDLEHAGQPDPTNVELKERVITLQEDLRRAAKVRDEAMARTGEKRLPISNTEVLDGRNSEGQGDTGYSAGDLELKK